MSSDAFPVQEYDYFYVTYTAGDMHGATILAQYKIASGGKNPNGFNIAHGYAMLVKMFNTGVIIQSWRQVTRIRKEEFENFAKSVQEGIKKTDQPHLAIVRNITTPTTDGDKGA